MPRAIYVYCILRHRRKPGGARVPGGLPGASRPAIEPLGQGLWLVLASVPLAQYGPGALEPSLGDLDWVGRVALAHQAVVEHFVHLRGVSVVPMKLFTMFSTVERARAGLQRQERTLGRVFERIQGCEEWGVRVTRGVPQPAVRRAPASRTGVAFLESRRRARDEAAAAARGVADAAELAFASLSEIARDRRRRPAAPDNGGATLLDAAFLVASRRRARFHAVAERLARDVARSGGQMTLTGPWPPYNFVDAEDGV